MQEALKPLTPADELRLAHEHLRDSVLHGEAHHLKAATSIVDRLSRSLVPDAGLRPALAAQVFMGLSDEVARGPLATAEELGAAIYSVVSKSGLRPDEQFLALNSAQLRVLLREIASSGGAV